MWKITLTNLGTNVSVSSIKVVDCAFTNREGTLPLKISPHNYLSTSYPEFFEDIWLMNILPHDVPKRRRTSLKITNFNIPKKTNVSTTRRR